MYASRGLLLPSLTAFFSYGSAYNRQHDIPDSVESYRTIIVADPSEASGYGFGSESLGTVANPEVPRDFKDQFTSDNVYKSYGISVSVPLFNNLRNRTNYVQQKIQYKNAQLTRTNLEYQIKNDVIRAVRNYEGAKKAFTITSDQLVKLQSWRFSSKPNGITLALPALLISQTLTGFMFRRKLKRHRLSTG
jgi:outer membrane protein